MCPNPKNVYHLVFIGCNFIRCNCFQTSNEKFLHKVGSLEMHCIKEFEFFQMTLMKIQKNPFAKGFRDRARSSSYRKRKSSFHDQLKEENEKRKSQEDEDEREGPPLSKRTLLSSHPTNSESPEQYRFIDHMTQLSNFHLAAQNFSQLSHGWRENSYFTQQFHNLQERSTPVTARAGRLF